MCAAYDSGLDSVAIGFIYGEVLRAAPLHHTRLTYAVFSRMCKRLRLFEHDFSRSSALTPEVCCYGCGCGCGCLCYAVLLLCAAVPVLLLCKLFSLTKCMYVCIYMCM